MPNTSTSATPLQALPVPVSGSAPDITSDLLALGVALEKKLVMVFSTQTTRNSVVASPTAGMLCVTTDSNTLWLYNGASWVQLPTVVPNITAGTAAPAGGNDGDFYFRY